MSQQIFSDIDPNVTTGLMLAALLGDFKDALMSGLSGTSRPTQLLAGGLWIDTSLGVSPTYKWSLKLYNGSADLTVLDIDVITGAAGFNNATDTFTIRETNDDTIGPILSLIKSRIAGSGQVKQDDLVARIRFQGHTNADADAVVAYLQATATEDMQSGSRGVIFSIYSTPAGTNAVAEHLRFLGGKVESVPRHKFNSLIYGQDTTSGTSSMVVTDDKLVTEITGSSGSNIHGIENDTLGSKVKVIINAGTTDLTIKHESLTASAGQRFKLPNSEDTTIPVGGSITAYYCSTDSRWKLLTGAVAGVSAQRVELVGDYVEWVSPITGYVDVIAHPRSTPRAGPAYSPELLADGDYVFSWGDNPMGLLGLSDVTPRSSPVIFPLSRSFKTICMGADGNTSYATTSGGLLYAWGSNDHGQLGVGDVTPRSSPVAVLGGHSFIKSIVSQNASRAMGSDGTIYSWGLNTWGELGVGDTIPRSSPVAVLGGLSFTEFYTNEDASSVFARSGGSLYAWGLNDYGQLGVGDTTPRSSPVAVLGTTSGFIGIAQDGSSVFALDKDGNAYAWGDNTFGQLGLGNEVSRSSPVAVMGGLSFREIYADSFSTYGRASDGTLYAWGENSNGQLGVGDTTNRSSPVAVLGGKKFTKVVCLQGSVVGIATDGLAYAWGLNDQGQLGVGDTTPRSSPVAVLGGILFGNLSVVYPATVIAKGLYGAIYGWGWNPSGEIGDGSTVNKSSPAIIPGMFGYKLDTFAETTYTKVPVTAGETYKIYMGSGAARFGTASIGTNIGRVILAYFG